MCELIVRVAEAHLTGDAATDCRRYHRGDVIAAVPDGHPWTPTELDHPHWVVVKVPDMTLAEGLALAAGELPDGARRHHHRRAFHIDPALLPADGTAVQTITLPAAAVRKGKRRKPPVADPDVIGTPTSPNAIG